MDGDTPRGVIHVLNHAVHLLSGGFWLGSLLLLPACLARLRDPAECKEAAVALRRFSRAGHVAVALVIASGVVNTILVLGRWPLDPGSPYQMLLAAKIVLVAGMTGLALVNRYVFVPDIRKQPDRAIAGIRAGTYAELALGAGVLILVAFFGLLDPAEGRRPKLEGSRLAASAHRRLGRSVRLGRTWTLRPWARSTDGLSTTWSPALTPSLSSTCVPRSRAIETLRNCTAPSAMSATCTPWLLKTTASAGTSSEGVLRGMCSSTVP